MNKRFPFDVYLVVLLPFVLIATTTLVTPLLILEHVHHQLAVAVAGVLAAVLALSVLFFWVPIQATLRSALRRELGRGYDARGNKP
jgi:hypothetical protein